MFKFVEFCVTINMNNKAGENMRKLKLILFTIFISIVLIPSLKAASYTLYRANGACNVRIGPGTNYSIIKNGTDNVMVQKDQELEYINTKSGTVNGVSGKWYGVKFDYATRQYTGYVWTNCVDTKTVSYSDDSAFDSQINDFPNSYKPYLRKLHAEHNNWVFKADYTKLNWNDAVSSESEKGMSAVSNLYPSLFFRDSVNPNGIVVDGTSWYAPCSDAVSYFMDARNFLNPKYLFMFEKLSYDSSQDAAVSGILSGTFMEGSFTENGVTKTYANAFIEAAKSKNVNATHLASRAVQEVGGKNPTSAVSGKVSGYEGYYNFYNIGATSGADNYIKGLQYAKNAGWNSISKAITGGAEFIASGYISKGQDTIYYEKFNTSSYRTRNAYTHQYMTNIMAPRSEAANVYNSYKDKGKLTNKFTFVIPVYNYMPADAFKLSKTDTVGGSTTPTTTTTQKVTTTTIKVNTTKLTTTKSVSSIINSAGYKITNNYVTGISYGMNASSITSKLAGSSLLNSSSNTKTSGVIATGDKIKINGTTYQVVVYGDLSGDGVINIKDLLLLKKHLLNASKLSGSYLEAAKISKASNVTIKDLLLLKKQLLGQYKISQ